MGCFIMFVLLVGVFFVFVFKCRLRFGNGVGDSTLSTDLSDNK